MAAADMDEHDALRMATVFGAEAIGLDQDVGTIEAGKLADLVILEGNPLDDLRNTNTIDRVMLNGRLYDGDTLDEVYPREKPLDAAVVVGRRAGGGAGGGAVGVPLVEISLDGEEG